MADTHHPHPRPPKPRDGTPQGRPQADFMAGRRSKNDSRPPEQHQPAVLWTNAHAACVAGWSVMVLPRPERKAGEGTGWTLVLYDEHHCIHVEYIRSTDPLMPERVWRLVMREFRTRCPNSDTVDIANLRDWMRTHPADCAKRRAEAGNERAPIGRMDYLPKACAERHPHPGMWGQLDGEEVGVIGRD